MLRTLRDNYRQKINLWLVRTDYTARPGKAIGKIVLPTIRIVNTSKVLRWGLIDLIFKPSIIQIMHPYPSHIRPEWWGHLLHSFLLADPHLSRHLRDAVLLDVDRDMKTIEQ